jgi:hypothetical protein
MLLGGIVHVESAELGDCLLDRLLAASEPLSPAIGNCRHIRK